MNAMEIRKREAKVFLITKQIEEIQEDLQGSAKENNVNQQQMSEELAFMQKSIQQQKEQILILNESTKQNLNKRHSMKQSLYQNY